MNDDTRRHDADFESLERRLDDLAGRERALPDERFEVRTLDRIRRESLELLGEPMPISRAPVWRSSWTAAIAASLLAVVTAAMFMWAGAPAPTPPQPLVSAEPDAVSDVDEFIETVAWLEASMPEFASYTEPSADLDAIDDLFDEVEQTFDDDEESI